MAGHRKEYWCGDSCLRGVILPKLFTAFGFSVLAPPLPQKDECRPGRFTYSHAEVADFLRKCGCYEIHEINTRYCLSKRSKGDVDFAAFDESSRLLLIAEVKSRLIPRYWGKRSSLERMLIYHLADPITALRAWRELEARGEVRVPPCGKGKGKGSYDSPASIAELVRSTVGFLLKQQESSKGFDLLSSTSVLVVSVITMFYAQPLQGVIINALASTVKYLERCLCSLTQGVRLEYACLLLYPDKDAISRGYPSLIRLGCVGSACRLLSKILGVPIRDPLLKCKYVYEDCSTCKYNRLCSSFIQGSY